MNLPLPRAWIAFATGLCVLGGSALVESVQADVTQVSAQGFTSEHRLVLATDPATAYAALVHSVHLWWDATHSFGGDASTFSIDDSAGGCFCELLASGGSVEHLRVVNAQRGRQLVLRGGLGPLQTMAVSGAMTFTFAANDKGTELVYRYVVGGYAPGGLDKLAEPVDQVQLGQLRRLQAFIAGGR
jgi:hypothetical protein